MREQDWPPKNSRKFVRSEDFGNIIVEEVVRLGDAYPNLDLTDAAATAFQWFNSKANSNRSFIGKKRFPSLSSFRAYVRQLLYNAGLRARRLRKVHIELSAVPENETVTESPETSLQQKERLLDLVQNLPEPHKSVFESYFFDETPLHLIGGKLDEKEAQRLFEEAVDLLQELAKTSGIN